MGYPLDVATAAPRPVKLGDAWYMIRPLPLWDLGMLHAFVRDAGGSPDRLDFDRLLSPGGLPTTLYAALKPCHPDFGYGDAIELAASILDDERAKLDLIRAAFHRAPSPDAWVDAELGRVEEEPGEADTDWARYVWALARDRGYGDAAGMRGEGRRAAAPDRGRSATPLGQGRLGPGSRGRGDAAPTAARHRGR